MQDYKDANHKPEMAIAITDFEALCDFVPPEELVEAVASVPELRDCLGNAPAAAISTQGSKFTKQLLKDAFSALMTCDPDKVHLPRSTLCELATCSPGSCFCAILSLAKPAPGSKGASASCPSDYWNVDAHCVYPSPLLASPDQAVCQAILIPSFSNMLQAQS